MTNHQPPLPPLPGGDRTVAHRRPEAPMLNLPPVPPGLGHGASGQDAPPPVPASPPGRSGRPPWLIWIVLIAVVGVLVAVILFAVGGDDDTLTATDGTPVTTAAPAAVAPSAPAAAAPATAAPAPATSAPVIAPATTAPAAVVPSPTDLARSVVQVQQLLGDQVVCTGSGTILEADGTILTNSHVIAQSETCPHDRIGIAVLDIPELPPQLLFEADILVDDPTLDLAVIRIARTLDGGPVQADFPTVEIGDSDALQLGDSLDVVGYPGIGGDTVTFTVGTISGFVTVPGLGDRSWLKTDATLAGGNSGGLAADASGRIVGIPTIVGTGQGRITDCRAVADSNGDGRIDQDDACVPVGGFINGIRPVNIALPLLEAARTATPTRPSAPMVDTPQTTVQPVVSTTQWSLDPEGGQPFVAVPPGAAQICLSWQYAGVPTGSAFEVVWFVDGAVEPAAGVTGTTSGPEADSFFACISNTDGLAFALYEVAWFIDEVPVFSEAVRYSPDGVQVRLDVVNETSSDVCVAQFAPSGAITFGLNELSAPIPPGGVESLPVVTGSYDVRVIDCDGLVLLEDTSGGVVINGDATYTLSSG
jgi:S1-C subfamily serine protease